jgi:uncharacterized protein (TIGR03435 family)
MRRLSLILSAAHLLAQTPDVRPKFEVAVVKTYEPGATVPPEAQGLVVSPDGIRATHVTLRGCLQRAYGLVEVDGPAWITEESYDIQAKAAAPISGEQLGLMFQSLLEERFQLKLHRETRDTATGVLEKARGGPKSLAPAQGNEVFQFKRIGGVVQLKNASMANLVSILRSPLGNMPMEPVVDQTGLAGRYDMTIDLSGFDPKDSSLGGYQEMRSALSAYVSQALERTYGLRLDRRMLPQERLVVDSGNRIPLGN